VFENTRVTDVNLGERCRVETERGTISAEDVVIATGFPIVDPALYFARTRPKRSYVVAVRLAEQPPQGMYYRASEPYFSIREHPAADGPVVLIGGESHKTGSGGSTADRYRRLLRAARRQFEVEAVEYRWSTQDYVPFDGVPFVGQVDDGLYVATGFGGWGMTNGTAAGMLIADHVRGRDNPWAEVYDPTRVKPLSGVSELVSHNVEATTAFLGEWLSRRPEGVDALAPGEADVFRNQTTPVAAYRDEDGALHVTSAVCTHMRCILTWNDGERTWDCPCHGSRFGPDGEVIEGPGNEDLRSFE
jgi:Rieske Fe-S protein